MPSKAVEKGELGAPVVTPDDQSDPWSQLAAWKLILMTVEAKRLAAASKWA